jgi:pimeloyl-ACP methyl ester carboxylesterase
MTDFLLLHGGCHGAWCWEPFAQRLREAGHTATAIDLPGRGDDAGAARTVRLDDYVLRASDALIPGAVVVAHSMGGLTASALAEQRPDDVAQVVLVSALLPADGEAGLPLLQQQDPSAALLQEGAIVFSGDQALGRVPDEHARVAFYGRCSEEDTAWATAQLCDEPIVPLMTPVALTRQGFGRVAKRYLGATDDRAVTQPLQQRMAAAWDVEVEPIDSDHSPFLSNPGALLAALSG